MFEDVVKEFEVVAKEFEVVAKEFDVVAKEFVKVGVEDNTIEFNDVVVVGIDVVSRIAIVGCVVAFAKVVVFGIVCVGEAKATYWPPE